jgi:hypothetical protein
MSPNKVMTPPGIAAPICRRAGPLRRLPHPARLGVSGKGVRRQQRRLSPRCGARCLVRAKSARSPAHRSRRMVIGRYRGIPEERPQ